MPAGISVEPASFSLAPVNASQQVTVSAQPNVAAGTYTAQFQGTGGGFTATASTSLVVEPLESNRTDFIRTDGNPMSMVFDPFHQLIYASNPEWNRVDIVSPATKQIVRSVPVASPQGLDLSLDSSLVYVSTQTQQMFAINTSSHAVVQRWFLPASGVPILQSSNESQYGTIQPEVVANGSVLLEVDQIYTTAVAMLEWNPVTNTITPITLPATFEPGLMARSGDGTKVIIASDTEPSAVVIFDSATNSITATRNFEGSVGVVKANPNGTQFIIYDSSGGLLLYDANLNVLGSIPPRFFDTGVVFSQDGGTIFVGADSNGLPATFTVDTNSLQVIGIAPAYVTETPYWVDPTGLIYGAANRGIALDDSTYFQNLPADQGGPGYEEFLAPDAGPVNASTLVTIGNQSFNAILEVWFGAQLGTNASLDSGTLQVDTPVSTQAGPVNVKILETNGIEMFDPLAFSYGPAPLFLSGDTGSPGGGALADIIAVGVSADASAIQVSVGGAAAQVMAATSFNPTEFAENVEPFPAVDVQVKLPAGQAGPADVTLTTAAGSGTLSKAFHYATKIADYASTDTFQAVTYDSGRNNLYLAAGDHLDVFSLASDQFVAPISLPSAGGMKQFAGMALTPDGSKLVVANLTDGSVDIVNPDNPSAATAVAIAPTMPGAVPGCIIGPSYVATTSTGIGFIVYGGLTAENCGPGGAIYELNLTTLAVSTPQTPGCMQASNVSSSRDGSKVAFGGSISSEPTSFIYDSASNTCTTSAFYLAYGAAAAGDGNIFAAGFRITDGQPNLINIMALPDPYYPNQEIETPSGQTIYPLNLQKMNDSGSLLYVPYQNSVDIMDVAHAALRQRVTFSEQILPAVDALAIDPTGQNIFLITDHGLTIATLTGAPLSIGSVTPASGAPGVSVTVRGSGFVQGTTVTVNGQSPTINFVDADTLTLTIPTTASGSLQFNVANPDGQNYILDNAFNTN